MPSRAVLFFITAVDRCKVVINSECCGAKASSQTDICHANRPTEHLCLAHVKTLALLPPLPRPRRRRASARGAHRRPHHHHRRRLTPTLPSRWRPPPRSSNFSLRENCALCFTSSLTLQLEYRLCIFSWNSSCVHIVMSL